MVESGRIVAGFAPAGKRTAEIRIVGSNDVELVAIEHGVFATDDIKGTVADVRMR